MCGLAGLLPGRNGLVEPAEAEALLRHLAHRGPDDQGWLAFGPSGVREGSGAVTPGGADALLLHRRLSILDLSAAGHQPMRSADGRYAVVLNGEIYNYLELRAELEAQGRRFVSSSDTEVLVEAWAVWGRAVLPRLTGMFAFAMLDTTARTLVLARDPFGIKPLYYARRGRALAFASEVKALLDLPGVGRAVDARRLYDYLRFGTTDHGDRTLFAEVRQLPPGHALEVALDRPEPDVPVAYWRLDASRRIDCSFAEAASRVRDLFVDSVRLHLRSDVPVGAALSGGIDSSAIVTAMRAVAGSALDLHAFSYIADDPALSEERWVDLAGGAARALVHKVRPTADELVADLDRLVETQDEPFGSTSIYAQYRVFRLARETGIKVMLDGQGADELLAGYPAYLGARLASLLRQGRLAAAARFLRQAAAQPGCHAREVLVSAGGRLVPPRWQGPVRRLVGEELVPPWLREEWFRRRGVEPRGAEAPSGTDVLREVLVASVAQTSLPMLLRYEDRNSMAFGIESRVPFLTPALAELVLALPEEYIVDADGTRKAVFRAAMRGLVPDAILDRRDKIGFATPEARWLGALRPWVEAVLRSETAARIPALDHAVLAAEWHQVCEGRRAFDFRVWRWLNCIRWADRFAVEFPA